MTRRRPSAHARRSRGGRRAVARARAGALPGGARSFLRASIGLFEDAESPDHAARDRYALGALLGGSEGESLQQAALASLKELGVVEPLRDLRAFYPELLA